MSFVAQVSRDGTTAVAAPVAPAQPVARQSFFSRLFCCGGGAAPVELADQGTADQLLPPMAPEDRVRARCVSFSFSGHVLALAGTGDGRAVASNGSDTFGRTRNS